MSPQFNLMELFQGQFKTAHAVYKTSWYARLNHLKYKIVNAETSLSHSIGPNHGDGIANA